MKFPEDDASVKSGFTFIIIPPKTSRMLQFRVSLLALYGVVGILLLLIGFGGYGLFRTANLHRELNAYEILKDEYFRQKVSVRKIGNAVDGFRNQISRLRELDYKLRIITDLEVERPSPSLYGVGGAVDNPDDILATTRELSDTELLTILDRDLAKLKEMATYQEESFNNLKAFLTDQQDLISRSPHRWPVRGFLSSTFGPRLDPFTGLQRNHEGIDIVARKGTVVRAPADGIVTFSGIDPSFGNMLVVDHGYGIITRYGHNESHLVREGQRVTRGMPITTVGTSGRSTGPHLHYEIRINDVSINPRNYIID